MSAVDLAKEIIKEFEGLRLTAYACPAGVPTIGYGHTKSVTTDDVARRRTITEAQADELLTRDANAAAGLVRRAVALKLSDEQLAALTSFVFNVGGGAFMRSTLREKVNRGDYAGAGDEFLKWDKTFIKGKVASLPGLARRRRAERDLFLRGVAP